MLHMQKLVYKFVNILSAMTHPFPPAGISDAQKLLTRLRMLALTCPGMQAHQILLQLLMRLTPVVLPDSTTTPLNDDPRKRTGSCHGFKTLHHSRSHEQQPATALYLSSFNSPLQVLPVLSTKSSAVNARKIPQNHFQLSSTTSGR